MDFVPVEYAVRLAGLYLPLVSVIAICYWQKPLQREYAAYLLAFCWNLPTLLAMHLVAQALGWWTFTTDEAVFLGFPVDLYLGWALLWGPLPLMLGRSLPVVVIAAGALLLDLALMPALSSILTLGAWWWAGDVCSVAICLVPALLLGRWTVTDRYVTARVCLQGIGVVGLLFGVIPAILVAQTGSDLLAPVLGRPDWLNALLVQPLIIAGVVGFTAGLEFARRGDGTPLPFDPPTRLVTSGPYAYVRNPMQIAAALGFAGLAMLVEQPLLWLGVVILASYGLGLAGTTEHSDMVRRYGDAWLDYCARVRNWWPRWRPYASFSQLERVYIARSCTLCSALGVRLKALDPQGLSFVAAEAHPLRPPTRMTYDPLDGSPPERGVTALARTLEHVHLGWAVIAWFLRFPGLAQVLQVIIDAAGGGPRELATDAPPSVQATHSLTPARGGGTIPPTSNRRNARL